MSNLAMCCSESGMSVAVAIVASLRRVGMTSSKRRVEFDQLPEPTRSVSICVYPWFKPF